MTLLLTLKLRATASDGGFPAKSRTCTAIIAIEQDGGTLIFIPNNYLVNIDENRPIDDVIETVTAFPTVSVIYMDAYFQKRH